MFIIIEMIMFDVDDCPLSLTLSRGERAFNYQIGDYF